MRTLHVLVAIYLIGSGSAWSQISGNISGRISGNVDGQAPQTYPANGNRNIVGGTKGSYYDRNLGSGSGYREDGQGGLVGTGNNAGQRCARSTATSYRCY
jgi:hypothetical protein